MKQSNIDYETIKKLNTVSFYSEYSIFHQILLAKLYVNKETNNEI